MSSVTSRFTEVYNHLLASGNVTNSKDFANKIGVSPSMMTEIANGRSQVGIKVIQNTVLLFKNISAEWLLTGRGEMLKKALEYNNDVVRTTSIASEPIYGQNYYSSTDKVTSLMEDKIALLEENRKLVKELLQVKEQLFDMKILNMQK